jgi:chitosanase
MPQPKLGKTQTKTAQAIVNVFETGRVQGDYGNVTVLAGDTGHLTYGRAQTTLSSGNLALLVHAYCIADGAQFATDLMPFLPALDALDISLDDDLQLHAILRRAGADPTMRTAQDAFFDRVYWNPAMQSAEALGLTRALAVAVVYDGHIHGSFRRIRDKVNSALGQPSAAGEKTWVARYVSMRRDWLATHPNALLHKTVYRMDTFHKLIGQGKWGLELPLSAHGVVINQAALGVSDGEPFVPSAGDVAERVLRLTNPLLQGNDVKKVQRALGFTGAAIDGVFGPDTDLAVRQFQQQRGLFVDGKVGNATRTALGL